MFRPLLPAMFLAAAVLSGCERLGIETPELLAQRKEAESKAIGAACRHAARAIEDCYTLNKKADKAAMFAGWREMNDYMRENQIEPVTPQIARADPAPQPASAPAENADAADAESDKPAAKGHGKQAS
ncbi:hypothetical protein V4F39_15140 [Aquincola sp. MAHUQ-54]|uniref:Conjugative transfer region protein TrbK n=1 Tax=Aquincola agrisoli TaxID=3119538 RepID=A0AAW9Q8B2_9BURK